MNARLFSDAACRTIFLKPESVNTKTKETYAHLDAKSKRENLCRLFSVKRNALRISDALQHRNG
jgi:hypothetical protein